jgi:putative salt-induced outer membrane protein YdiY
MRGWRGALAPSVVVFCCGLASTATAREANFDLSSDIKQAVAANLVTSSVALQDAAAPAAPSDPSQVSGSAFMRDLKSFNKGWTGTIELGLNGAEGNSTNLNFRAGVSAERKGEIWDSKASLTYLRASEDSEVTSNRFVADLRNDFKFAKGSRWRVFTTGRYEYDDFQQWIHRITLGAGIGYAFIENERTTLIGRVGVGASKKIGGGAENKWTPELILGADLNHKISDRQKITASVDFLPSLDNFSDYRIIGKAAWELLVDPESKLNLKIGIEDDYDSSPGPNRKSNDFRYFAVLGWAF